MEFRAWSGPDRPGIRTMCQSANRSGAARDRRVPQAVFRLAIQLPGQGDQRGRSSDTGRDRAQPRLLSETAGQVRESYLVRSGRLKKKGAGAFPWLPAFSQLTTNKPN